MANENAAQNRQALITGFLAECGVFLRTLELKLATARDRIARGHEFTCADWREMAEAAHNIKRMAAFVGLAATQNLAHEIEKVLCLLAARDIRFSANAAQALRGGIDTLRDQFAGLNKNAKEAVDMREITALLQKVQNAPQTVFVCGPRVEFSSGPEEKNGGVCGLPSKRGESNAQSDLTKPVSRYFGFD